MTTVGGVKSSDFEEDVSEREFRKEVEKEAAKLAVEF